MGAGTPVGSGGPRHLSLRRRLPFACCLACGTVIWWLRGLQLAPGWGGAAREGGVGSGISSSNFFNREWDNSFNQHASLPSPEARGLWGELSPWWHRLEAPIWYWWRRRRRSGKPGRRTPLLPNGDKSRFGNLNSGTGGQEESGDPDTRRLKVALTEVCQLMLALGAPAAAIMPCPEATVGGRWPLLEVDRGMMWSDYSTAHWHNGAAAIGVHRDFLRTLRDDELRALLGLELGRMHLGGVIPIPMQSTLIGWWFVARIVSDRHLVEHLGIPVPSSFPGEMLEKVLNGSTLFSPWDGKLEPSKRWHMIRAATSILVLNWARECRNGAIARAIDRFAVLAGGGVGIAASALAKAQNYGSDGVPLDKRVWDMQRWSSSPKGRQLTELAKKFAILNKRKGVLLECVSCRLVAGTVCILLVMVSAFASAVHVAIALSITVAVLESIILTAVLDPNSLPPSVTPYGIEAHILTSTTAAVCVIHLLGAFRIWWLYYFAELGKTSFERLMTNQLPEAVEAAAGAVSIMHLGAKVRLQPLAALDKDLRARWDGAVRGLAVKLADLRRVASTGDHGASTGLHTKLHTKLAEEVRQVLLAELSWMRRVLGQESAEAIGNAAFWWLHEDAPVDCWTDSPCPQEPGAFVHIGDAHADQLVLPRLSDNLVGSTLPGGPLQMATHQELMNIAEGLAVQHRELDAFQMALRDAGGRARYGIWRFNTLPRAAIERCISDFLSQTQGMEVDMAGDECNSSRLDNRRHQGMVAAACILALPSFKLMVECYFVDGGEWHMVPVGMLMYILAIAGLLCVLSCLRLPQLWAQLEFRLASLARDREEKLRALGTAAPFRPETVSFWKALVIAQGVQTAQNLDQTALCVLADFPDEAGIPKWSMAHRAMQLLYAVLPRRGRRGQRRVSTDSDCCEAMSWICGGTLAPPCSMPPQEELQPLLATLARSQRRLCMLFRLFDLRASFSGTESQGSMSKFVLGHLYHILQEHRLCLEVTLPTSLRIDRQDKGVNLGVPFPPSQQQVTQPSGRALGDLDEFSCDDSASELSGTATGTVRRILASDTSEEKDDDDGGSPEGGTDASSYSDNASEDSYDISPEGIMPVRILAASDISDGGSSDSASSAGFNSFGVTHSSMWSGMSRTASSASSLGEDLLIHRRPLLEGYASALRPLFMTRGDIAHLLAKFPEELLAGPPGGGISGKFAAHRELLDKLFASLVVAVKSTEKRGSVKLAFATGFTYGSDVYGLGPIQTSLLLVAHGVRRLGPRADPFPPVYEEEEERDEVSEVACSAAYEDPDNAGSGALEFEEISVPLCQVSSRALLLAELMQSDQCQLVASLSQGTHSKYGHRALRRRRRTLRHVREATQLLVSCGGHGSA